MRNVTGLELITGDPKVTVQPPVSPLPVGEVDPSDDPDDPLVVRKIVLAGLPCQVHRGDGTVTLSTSNCFPAAGVSVNSKYVPADCAAESPPEVSDV